jgi:PKD repeat protein
MIKLFTNRWAKAALIAVLTISCTEDEKKDPAPLIKADFTFAIDEEDGTTVTFTNTSIGFASVAWDFGDGEESTETNPSHSFEPGTYSVELTATSADGRTSTKTKEVEIADPQTALKKLTGTTSKTWKLLRDKSKGQFPMEIGPQSRTQIYWSLGGAAPMEERPCVFDDEYIFNIDGTFTYETNGMVFADAGEFGPWSDEIGSLCVDADAENFVGKNGEDLSAWNDGVHSFEYDIPGGELTVTGLGAFIGLQKVATDGEVLTPQESVTYQVVKLTDGAVDTLIVEALHGGANYWRFVLVHYDDPSMEPAIPGVDPPDECDADAAEVIEGSAGIKLTVNTAAGSFGGFGGVTGGRVANPAVTEGNSSCYVNQYSRSVAGCETWGGVAINLPSAIDFGAGTAKKKFTMKVYAEDKPTAVVLRLERLAHPDTEPSAERTANITAAGEWQEVTFDFSDITDANTYKNLVLYFDRGTCSEAVVYYFDDLTQVD